MVRIEVTDEGGELPDVPEASDDATSGRGLALVETLSSAWGVESRPGGKTVWFEVDRPDSMARRITPAPL